MMATQKINDCYFYYYSKCSKGDACPFRHEPAALGSEIVCHRWKQGKCYNMNCIHRHMDIQKNRSKEPCYWETQPGGCRKPHCAFLHRYTRDLNEMPDSSGHLDIPAYDILGVTSRESGVQSSAFGISQRLSCENIGNVIASETQLASPKVNQLVITANDEESDQESSNGNTPVKMQRVTYDSPKKITLRKSDQNIQDNAALGIMTLEDIKRERAIRSFVQNKIAAEQVSNKAVAVLSDSKPKTHLSSGRTIVLAPGQTSETSQDVRNLPAASGQRSSIKARLGLHSNSSGKDASVDEKPTSVESQIKRQRSDGNEKSRSDVSDSKLGIKTLFEIKQEKERLLAGEENKTGSGGIESKGGTVKTSGEEHGPRQETSQRKRRSLELYRPRGTSATTAGKDEAQSASSVIKTGKSSVKPGSADEKTSGSSWAGVKTLAEIMHEKRLKAAATACKEDPSSSGGGVKIMQSELKTVGSTTSTHTDDPSSQPDLEKAAKRKFTPIVFDLDVKENKSANNRGKVADRTRMSELKSGSGELVAEDQQAVKEPARAAALKSAKSQSAASLCAMSEELSENSSASPACDSSNDANQTVQSLHVPSLVSSSTNQPVVSLPDVCDSSNQKPLVVLKRQHSNELHPSDHTAAKRGLLSPALGSPKEGPTVVTSKLPTCDDDLLSNQLDDLIDEIGVDILPAAKTVTVDQLNEDDLLLEMQELLS